SFGWERPGSRRVVGDSPPELTVTRERISGPGWSLRWDPVKCVYLGETPAGALRALFIEAFDPADIELSNSRMFRLNRMLSGPSKAVIAIVEKTVDRPVEQLMLDLERIAGATCRWSGKRRGRKSVPWASVRECHPSARTSELTVRDEFEQASVRITEVEVAASAA